jgi:hypothetical protein
MFGVPYHFLAIHFPVVLVLLALFYDLRGIFDIGYRLTLGAAAAALVAASTGLMLSGGSFSGMTVHAGASLLGSFCILPWLLLEILGSACVVFAVLTGHQAVLSN